jgi:hypothetical protein
MSLDTHDRMIHAFQEYFKHQEYFEYHGTDDAGIKARYWLSEIKRMASIRREEIQTKRKKRKIARNGKPGRPSRATRLIENPEKSE